MNGESRPHSSYKTSLAPNTLYGQAPATAGTSSFQRPDLNGFDSGLGLGDEVEDVDRAGVNYLGLDGYASPQQIYAFPDYSIAASSFRGRVQQTPVAGDFRSGQIYANGHMSAQSFDKAGQRALLDWQNLSNGAVSSNPRSPMSQDHSAYLNPQMQQLLAVQLRSPYGQMYNPYALQLGANTPYLPVIPMSLPGMDPAGDANDSLIGNDVQSALMWEFKSNTKSKRFELKDLYNHIAEFSGDQHGSRFIQTKLETANSDEKDRVFKEIQPNAIPLMTDVFGNYVIQKFFEHGDQTHKKILANKMRGQVLSLSLQMYGCRVVQKALDHVLVDQQASLIGELESHVLKCVKDQNGNHVIQKAIERCPANTIGFIIAAFQGQVHHLSIHPYGCRVIQRCLERCDGSSKIMIMGELMEGIQSMISDQYGNYVVQHVVDHDDGEAKRHVLTIVAQELERHSKHKFASNVVEKCIEEADDGWRRHVIVGLANGEQRRCEGEGVLVTMIKDNFGNYVIRKLMVFEIKLELTRHAEKLLDTLCMEDYLHFVEMLWPAVTQAKRTGCGKQVMAIEKKMHKFQPHRNGLANNNTFHGHAGNYQLPIPTPPYASNYGSAATTPPPLTADSRSLQSSRIPSISGDAVEGAAIVSRKGSDLAESHYLR